MAAGADYAKPTRRAPIGRQAKGIVVAAVGLVLIATMYLTIRQPACLFSSCTPVQEALNLFTIFAYFAGFILIVAGAYISVTGPRV